MKNSKWALILGGSKGLGWASAKKLAEKGWNLLLIHRDPKNQLDDFYLHIEQLKSKGVQCLSYNKDATQANSINQLIQLFQEDIPALQIDLVLHSIAKGSVKKMVGSHKLTATDFEISLQAMGYSLYLWVDSLFEANLLNKPAKILAFTSEGNQKTWAGYAAISAAKGVLEAVSKNIALEFSKHGITSNCIQAGVTLTDAFKQIPNYQQIADAKAANHPLQRLTTPEDVANVVYLLSLPEAAWINGSIIKVDGGESLQ